MNWQDLINNSELVYASTIEDKGFCTWSLKKTTCKVSFYEIHPIEDIDRVLCGILESNKGFFEENKIATLLGFNVLDDFEISQKRYADKAELDIFKAIIQPVLNWGLIEYDLEKGQPDILKLTDLGYRALLFEKKYVFFLGQKKLFENPVIKPVGLKENMFFPYYSAFGEFSEITEKTQIKYENININEVFDIEESELIRRHKLQSKEHYHLYKSDLTKYYEFSSCQVDIRIYKHQTGYYSIIFQNNQICIEATELLNSLDNEKLKEKKIEWGLYLKLIKDPNAVLDYDAIFPFEDLLEFDSLVKDNRLRWNDKQLFNFIAENANANHWFSISNHCPIDVLKQYLQTFSDKLDWATLSLRIDDDFLIQNATEFPWNFEVISAKEDISIEVIKILLLIPELKEEEWDWDRIIPQLDFEFIKANIDKIDFELSELTKTEIDNVKPLLVKYPSKRWDWLFISTDYDLSYILDNILDFSSFLKLKKVINRVFVSENDIKLFCQSPDFFEVLSAAKESSLRDYQPNQANYNWTDQLINWLERTGYLDWESGSFVVGFECNQFNDWDFNFFTKYNSKIKTTKGLNYVSAHISDYRIINKFPDFNWNWDIISENTNLINNSDFIISVKDKLNFSILLKGISEQTLEDIFETANISVYLETNLESWINVTEKSSKKFILKHIDYNWDWLILTKRFCSTIKIDSLGNPKWINKWDWSYITQNIDLSIIQDKLELYLNYWDWDYLSIHLDKEFTLNNLPDFNDYWNWSMLLEKRFEKSDLQLSKHLSVVSECISVFDIEIKQQLWKLITSKFDYNELEDLILQTYYNDVFLWDYSHFYDLPGFNPRQFLNKNVEFIDWKTFSGSRTLNKSFYWDKSLFSYEIWLKDILKLLKNHSFGWDFKSLSRLDNINWNDSILSINSEKWDWEYLSEFSICFKKGKEFTKRFSKFSKYINFRAFSKRTDSDITEQLLVETIDYEWDWSYLSQNVSVEMSLAFIKENKDKSWNWTDLSKRNDIIFENEIFIELSNQVWDWEAISNRKDICFSEELIIKLFDKPLDWYLISQSEFFVPNAKILSILKIHNLDWNAISINNNLSTEILWNYKDCLIWSYVTKNQVFDISDVSLITKYQDYVDWDFISQSENFKITVENLKLFKDKLNWVEINSRKDFKISDKLLETFSEVLNWSNISKSMEIQFTEELIERYRNKWDWQLLRKNPQILDKLANTFSKYQAEFNCVEFIEKFNYCPYIYHFTHLFSAIPVIVNRKIFSRDKTNALGLLKYDAAGTVVERSSKAHSFARFYFRPQTPTQFYNECLGWDGSLKTNYGKSYYGQARNLGLPKCPIPVFFKFDLKEVLMKMPDKCYYSTGNMQTDRAKVLKVANNPNYLQTNYLYDNISDAFSMAGGPYNYDRQRHISIMEKIKEYSQQEFLVSGEFDFSSLDSFEIICYNEEYAKMLKSKLGNDPICEKINANGWDIFHRGNRKLIIDETETEVSITSEYQDGAYLSIKGEGLKNIEILNPERIQKETPSEIIAYPEIKFTKTEQSIEVHFVDTTIGKRDWLVYKN